MIRRGLLCGKKGPGCHVVRGLFCGEKDDKVTVSLGLL